MAGAGAVTGQEAIPANPDIVEAGGAAAIPGAATLPDVESVVPSSGHSPTSLEGSYAAPPGEAWVTLATSEGSPGGSRLLRALAESTGPSGQGRDGRAAERTAAALVAEGCPRALLRRLLAGAAGEADALAALAIETEVLTLCSERQRIVTALFETEARLKELREPAEPVSVFKTSTAAPPAPAVLKTERETPAMPAQPAPDTRAEDTRAKAPAPSVLLQELISAPGEEVVPERSLGWFSILGSAGVLRAGITDGTGVWFVREGDALPGGSTVAAIAGRPPSVRTTGPEGEDEDPLPFRARPRGAR
ncbi:MAG: hypothetical protein OXO52_17420 [Rhodospirillales bacterium]|nr:hypothetical protein [Rhodospirillales bacterium]MDE0379703.1 hypothetical protein [Rhodospirillales bacterium]